MLKVLIVLTILVGFLIVILLIGNIPGYFVWGYPWDRDVNAYFELADQSSSLDKKLEYLKQYKQALLDKGLDKGNARYIFKTPQTDLENQMKVLDSLFDRLESAIKMDKSSLEYQQAIKQITTDEFQGFNNCLFRAGYKRQSFMRFLFMGGGKCQNGKYAGESESF